MSAEIEAMGLRLSRLETTNADLKAQVQNLTEQLNNLLHDPVVLQSLAQASGRLVIDHLRQTGLDAIDPGVVAVVSNDRVDEFSFRLDFNLDDIRQAGAFAVFAPNPDANNEMQELTALRRRHYDAIVTALLNIKRKKFKGTSLWINLHNIQATPSALVGAAALSTQEEGQKAAEV